MSAVETDRVVSLTEASVEFGRSLPALMYGVFQPYHEKGKGFHIDTALAYREKAEKVLDLKVQQRYFLVSNRVGYRFGKYLVDLGIMGNKNSYTASTVISTGYGTREGIERWERITKAFTDFVIANGLMTALQMWEHEYEVTLTWDGYVKP